MLGNEILAYFNVGAKQLVSRIAVNAKVAAGEKTQLIFDRNKLYFFDSKTEERIINN